MRHWLFIFLCCTWQLRGCTPCALCASKRKRLARVADPSLLSRNPRMRDAPPPALPSGVSIAGGGPVVAMYARLASLEQPVPRDMSEYWTEPSSSFLIKGGSALACVWPSKVARCALTPIPPNLIGDCASLPSITVFILPLQKQAR